MVDNKKIVVIVIVLVILLIGYIGYSSVNGSSSSGTFNPSQTSTSSTPTLQPSSVPSSTPLNPTPVPQTAPAPQPYVPTISGVWAQESKGQYTCPTSVQSGWCIVPLSTAQSVCNSDPKCIGYVQDAYSISTNTVQLTSVPPVSNSTANGTFYAKTT